MRDASINRASDGGSMRRIVWSIGGLLLIVIVAFWLLHDDGPQPGKVQDEAMLANRPVSTFPAADEDYFKAMDNGASLSPDEVKGRNMWLVWSGGNDHFWDTLIKSSFGTF